MCDEDARTGILLYIQFPNGRFRHQAMKDGLLYLQ